jgi:hypothetical protein
MVKKKQDAKPLVFGLTSLFDQLGLPSSASDVDRFVSHHKLLPDVRLHEASFWTEPQRELLRQALACDSDWSYAADQLAVLLSPSPK